jgi:hypothetical protein
MPIELTRRKLATIGVNPRRIGYYRSLLGSSD